jgi:E3 ubiquitin-protein ligase SHPRH
MPLFQGRVQVLSANSNNTGSIRRDFSGLALDAQDASSNLRGFRSLFAAPDVHDHAQGTPKRRKLDSGNAVPVQSVDLDEQKSIVLADVSLDLVTACNIPMRPC